MTTKLKNEAFWCQWINERQLNSHHKSFNGNSVFYNLYKNMSVRKEYIWHDDHTKCEARNGGIFNVEYSPDGRLLVAATENKNVLIFSAQNHSLQHQIINAHGSSVNLVKFLDSRMFATCSDDCSLAIWDLRNLSSKINSLVGHKNWVKSIEYDRSRGILLSAAYDNSIIEWDINNYREHMRPKRILSVKNMLRMRLTPDCSKMIISTCDAYLMVIHELDLSHITYDLRKFHPNLYFLMQKNCSGGYDIGSWFNHLFTAKRNRVELITDFPEGNKNGNISSLEVHPYGWCVLSRNTNADELSEWSCVHDIQPSIEPLEYLEINPTKSYYSQTIRMRNESDFGENSRNPLIIISSAFGSRTAQSTVLQNARDPQHLPEPRRKIYKNLSRLRFYKREVNENQGFIKEVCFSPDGRLICSPYQYGYRLLSFDNKCNEMSDCVRKEAQELFELKTNLPHPDYVVTTKFSPTHCQIASGCLGGRVVFSQPIL